MNNRGEAYTENPVGQRGVRNALKRFSLVKHIIAVGDSVNVLEAHTEESSVGAMVEIWWHCRETRQQTEKTNFDLRHRHGEIPEGPSGSLAPGMLVEKRRELGRPHRLPGGTVKVCGY